MAFRVVHWHESSSHVPRSTGCFNRFSGFYYRSPELTTLKPTPQVLLFKQRNPPDNSCPFLMVQAGLDRRDIGVLRGRGIMT